MMGQTKVCLGLHSVCNYSQLKSFGSKQKEHSLLLVSRTRSSNCQQRIPLLQAINILFWRTHTEVWGGVLPLLWDMFSWAILLYRAVHMLGRWGPRWGHRLWPSLLPKRQVAHLSAWSGRKKLKTSLLGVININTQLQFLCTCLIFRGCSTTLELPPFGDLSDSEQKQGRWKHKILACLFSSFLSYPNQCWEFSQSAGWFLLSLSFNDWG